MHELWQEKEHTHPIGNDTEPFSLYSFERVHRTSVECAHCPFSQGRAKTFMLAALSQFQEVVSIPQVAGIETITNLEGFGFWVFFAGQARDY